MAKEIQTSLGVVTVNISDLNLYMESAANSEIVRQSDAIRNTLFNVLGTRKGQRLMRAGFGSYLNHMLFQKFGKDTASDIKSEIYSAVKDKDNELIDLLTLNIKDISVVGEAKTGTYKCKMTCKLVGLGVSETYQFSLIEPGKSQ